MAWPPTRYLVLVLGFCRPQQDAYLNQTAPTSAWALLAIGQRLCPPQVTFTLPNLRVGLQRSKYIYPHLARPENQLSQFPTNQRTGVALTLWTWSPVEHSNRPGMLPAQVTAPYTTSSLTLADSA